MDLNAIDALLTDYLVRNQERGLPGFVVAVGRGGYHQVFARGVADRDTGEPMDANMRFRIGSVSKLIVGLCLIDAIDARQMQLKDPVSRYVPDVPKGDNITIGDLAAHRTGFVDALRNPDFRSRVNQDVSRVWKRDEVLEASFAATDEPISTRISYANVNAILIASAIEACVRIPFREHAYDVLARRFWPHDILYSPDSTLAGRAPSGYRHGPGVGRIEYGDQFFDATHYSPSWSSESGCHSAKIEDIVKLLFKLSFNKSKNYFSDEYYYLIHFFKNLFGHSGDVPGYSSFAYLHVKEDTYCVVLCNLSNYANGQNPAVEIGSQIFGLEPL